MSKSDFKNIMQKYTTMHRFHVRKPEIFSQTVPHWGWGHLLLIDPAM